MVSWEVGPVLESETGTNTGLFSMPGAVMVTKPEPSATTGFTPTSTIEPVFGPDCAITSHVPPPAMLDVA